MNASASRAYSRKKQPELIRRALLDCAARMAAERGLGAVTVQAVAEAAGVTKGGLFHHFPSKQALVEGVYADFTERLDAQIDAAMAADPNAQGRFTRAYVAVTFADPMIGRGNQWAALYAAALTEPSVRRRWSDWFARRLERHRDTDDGPILEIVRLAADGAWLAYLLREGDGPAPDLHALRERLFAMTRPD